jgi:dTDP-4-amino-4,6-dideoxygalactose transaminase
MNIPYVRLQDQFAEISSELSDKFAQIHDSGLYIRGPESSLLEHNLLKYTSADAVALCNSGSDALYLALRAAGITHGDKVITPSLTFIATTESILRTGAVPVFVDIDIYYHGCTDEIDQACSDPAVKAILFVDTFGQTPDISKLRDIASKHEILLVEDAAHSFGAEYNYSKVGSLVDITCVSFNPVKNFGAMGSAGAVFGSADVVNKVNQLKNHGRHTSALGVNSQCDELQAAVLNCKLPLLDGWIDRKQAICRFYTSEINRSNSAVLAPCAAPWGKHTYYSYVVLTPHRDELRRYLASWGIETKIQYPVPTHTEIRDNTHLPSTEAFCNNALSIPCYHSLADNEVEFIANCIRLFKLKK